MRGDAALLLARDRRIAIDLGAVLHLLPGERRRQTPGVRIVQLQLVWWQQDLPAGNPVAGIDHGPDDDPAVIAEQKIVDAADRAVSGFDGVSMDVRSRPQHVSLPYFCRTLQQRRPAAPVPDYLRGIWNT